MDLYVDDDAFVRAPRSLVYARLADPDSYEDWWPGLRVVRRAPVDGSWLTESEDEGGPSDDGLIGRPREPGRTHLHVTFPAGRLRRRLAITARPYRFRADKGLYLAFEGDLVGKVEWWLETGHGGTIVHHLSRLDVRRGGVERLAAAYRTSIRRAVWGLKDDVQSEVRERVGLPP